MPLVATPPGSRIDAEFQSQTVNPLSHRFHVREFVVGLYGELRPTALSLPSVVNVHISPAMAIQTGRFHSLG